MKTTKQTTSPTHVLIQKGKVVLSVSLSLFNLEDDGRLSLLTYGKARDKGITSKEYNAASSLIAQRAVEEVREGGTGRLTMVPTMKGKNAKAGEYSDTLKARFAYREGGILAEIAIAKRKLRDEVILAMTVKESLAMHSALDWKFIYHSMLDNSIPLLLDRDGKKASTQSNWEAAISTHPTKLERVSVEDALKKLRAEYEKAEEKRKAQEMKRTAKEPGPLYDQTPKSIRRTGKGKPKDDTETLLTGKVDA